MRFLKLASNKNPTTDYVLLNGGYFDKDGNKNNNFNSFQGLLCTSFQTLGISRKLEFLSIKNRQFSVDNKTSFKKYNLTIEILSKYSEYDTEYRRLITFLDRNKKDGFRLYYRPYGNNSQDIRYCLCDVETSIKNEKMQPVGIVVNQNSLWLGQENKKTTSYVESEGNLFVFKEDENIEDYHSISFYLDNEVNDYCVSFFNGAETRAFITNDSYNEVPLKIRIYGEAINPVVALFKKGETNPIRELQIMSYIDKEHFVEINANILENGVWYVNKNTNKKIDYSELVNNKLGSPYFYIDNGDYYIEVKDDGGNICLTDVFWQEEYSE